MPAETRHRRRRGLLVLAILAVGATAVAALSALTSDPARHSVVERIWLEVTNADAVRIDTAAAHGVYNRLVWGNPSPAEARRMRRDACETMKDAVAAAEAHHGADVVRETAAVRDVVCANVVQEGAGSPSSDHQTHGVLDGHETWLRVNAG